MLRAVTVVCGKIVAEVSVFVSPLGPHRPPARVHYKTKRHARWRQIKKGY
jgi:hypothetical protein